MKKIKYKLILVMVGLCAFMAIVLGSYNIQRVISNKNFAVAEYRQVLNEQFDRTIRLETETAVSLVENIYRQQQQGMFTEDQAKMHAARLLRELRFDKDGDGYFWVDTTEGVNVVLLGRNTEGKNRINAKDEKGNLYIQEIIKNGVKDGGGYSDFWFAKPNEQEATPKRGYSLLFKPYHWVIGTGNWIDHIDQLIAKQEEVYYNSMVKDIMFTSLIIILVLLGAGKVTWYVSRKISDPIAELSGVVKQIAMGDLRNTVQIKSEDEVGELGKDVNVMTGDLKKLIAHLAISSEQLAASSEEMTASAEQSAQASNQVAISTVEVADRVNGQLTLVDSAVAVVDRISKEIQQFATNTTMVSTSATKTEQAANDGKNAIEKAITQMRAIENKTNETAKVINELEVTSKQIGEIVESITVVAEKTHMLTKNATKGGAGFSAVADEIAALVEESQAFRKQVIVLINEMQQKTSQAVRFTNESKQEVGAGSEAVSLAGKGFLGIVQMVKEITTQIQELSVATKQIAHESENVLDAVLGIDEESKKIAEQTENVSAATEEQSASMQEVASASQALATLAFDLHEAIGKFKI